MTKALPKPDVGAYYVRRAGKTLVKVELVTRTHVEIVDEELIVRETPRSTFFKNYRLATDAECKHMR